MTGYVICATPRSGSTLLCHLLRASGVAGWPESWFRGADRAGYATDWGVAARGPDYAAAVLRAGRGPNGVFGLRLMWDSLVEEELAALGPLRFIWLRRQDLVAQAISRHRAEVSGTWHLGFEEAAQPVEPAYDRARIAHWMAEAVRDNLAWQGWFSGRGITPLCLTYEALADDPGTVAQTVLDHLGLVAAAPLVAGNRRMADAQSAAWVRRFRAEGVEPDRAGC